MKKYRIIWHLCHLIEKISIIMRLFLGLEVTSVRHLQKKPRPSFLLLAFVLRCLYRTVLNRSAADSWVAFGSEGCSLIKKLVKLTCAIVLDLFGGQGDPRGGAQWPPEAVGLQQVGQCDTSERIRGQPFKVLKVGGCPSRTGSNPIFDKNHTKAWGTLQVHWSSFDKKEKERSKTTVFFKFLTALILLDPILILWQISFCESV